MNYDAFMEPLTWFLTGMEKHSDEYIPEKKGKADDFDGAMRHFMASFQTSQLQCAMNELSNHDHSRFLTRTNGTAGRVETHGSEAAELWRQLWDFPGSSCCSDDMAGRTDGLLWG